MALATYSRGFAAGAATVAFSPPATSATVGATVAIDVTIANVDPSPGLANYDLTLHFDPAIMRLDSLKDSGFITSGDNVVVCATGNIDNAGGSVEAQCQAIPLSGAPGVSTGGPVALLHGSFTATAVGTSPLTLSGTLAGPSGTAIPASFSNGSIRVTATAATSPTAAAPTLTSIASPVATATPAPEATATSTPTSAGAAVATTTAAEVRLPDTGSGNGQQAANLGAILTLTGAIAVILSSIAILLRQPWRRLTRNR